MSGHGAAVAANVIVGVCAVVVLIAFFIIFNDTDRWAT